jgi:aryl-alcohol dehydrogenase-like predicted oxidoreductase
MRKVPLGSTGVEVSAMCLGAMWFGTKNDEATSTRMLDLYVEAGGSFIDTANVYACWFPGAKGGESEEVLGRWMKSRGNRSQLFIATKLGSRLQPSGRGLRPEQIREECEKSLRRLQTDVIDLYYAHFYDPVTPVEQSLPVFDELRKAGKIRFIGASNHPAWRLAEANTLAAQHNWPAYCCIPQRLSYLRPKVSAEFGVQLAATPELLDYCALRNVTPVAYSPLLGGVYGGRADRKLHAAYQTADNEARLATLKAMADELKASPNTLVLAWMLHHQPRIIPLFAASSEEQMRQNLAALSLALSSEQMERLNKAGA